MENNELRAIIFLMKAVNGQLSFRLEAGRASLQFTSMWVLAFHVAVVRMVAWLVAENLCRSLLAK